VAGEPLTVQVMHLGATPLRLTTDMTVGYIDPYEGPTYEMSNNDLRELHGTEKEQEKFPLPGVEALSEPDDCSGATEALLQKHVSNWAGNLGIIRGVEHRVRLRPGAVPVRQHPCKAGPLAREEENSEFERMRCLGVIDPSAGEWASPVVMVPKPDGSVRVCIDYRKLKFMTIKDAYYIPRVD